MSNICFNMPTVVYLNWSDFKSIVTKKSMLIQYCEDTTHYTAFAIDGPIGYRSIVVKPNPTSFDPENPYVPLAQGYSDDPVWSTQISSYDQTVNDAALIDFVTSHKTAANQPLEPHESDGRKRTVVGKPIGLEGVNFYSQNWCDKCTWAKQATRVVEEVASDSGDHTQYNLTHTFVIDTFHGRITQEDVLTSPANFSYRVVVTVNDVVKTEKDPHTLVGDFVVNYESGNVVFNSALGVNDVVKVTYHYAGSSEFTIAPLPGTTLIISFAEVQFSTDMVMTDSVRYAVYGPIDIWAPQYLQSNGGPYPSGTKVPLKSFVYKRIQDFLNDAMRAYPTYPAMGGNGWRSMQQPVVVFDWDYIRGKAMSAAYGLEIRCKLDHDTAFGGTYATVTFYCDYDS